MLIFETIQLQKRANNVLCGHSPEKTPKRVTLRKMSAAKHLDNQWLVAGDPLQFRHYDWIHLVKRFPQYLQDHFLIRNILPSEQLIMQ